MNLEVFPLVTLSVCECGRSTLKPDIQLGTKYTLDLDSITTGLYMCGGCKEENTCVVVKTTQQLNPDAPMAYLPLGLFGPEPIQKAFERLNSVESEMEQ
jgi:hypothetical protein